MRRFVLIGSCLLWLTVACSGDGGESGSDASMDSTDTGQDGTVLVDTAAEVSVDTGADAEISPDMGAETETVSDAGTDVFSDTGTDAVTDTGPPCTPCEEGLSLNELDCSCSDIDECMTDNGGCSEQALCTNAEVSGEPPSCLCNEGYFGDGLICQAWTSCLASEYAVEEPTATTDGVCVARSMVPGVIEAEDYGDGQLESFFHDASPGNDGGAYREDDVDIYAVETGFVVAMQSGEWLRYPIYVPTAGRYRMSILARSEARGRHLNIYIGDVAVVLGLRLTDSHEPFELRSVYLQEGQHIITVSGGAMGGVLFDALGFAECSDEDGDGFCASEDCAETDPDCARGLCCRNLVAHWTFDEPSGLTVGDSSPAENHGTIQSEEGASWVPGVLGGALMLDSGAEVSVPNASSLEVGMTYSVATWFKATEGPGGYLVDFSNLTNSAIRFDNTRLYVVAGNTLSSSWSSHYAAKAMATFPLEEWHHLVAVVSGTSLWIYIDGVLDAGRIVYPYNASNGNSPLILGRLFSGSLDDTRIYDEVLNAEDVAELYREQASQLTQCNDGIDNDGNGLSDMGDDPGCSSVHDASEATDQEAPSVPEELEVIETVPHMVHLGWTPSTDDEALGGYHVYRDGRRVDTVMRTAFYDTAVEEGESYTYSVTAMDHAGRESNPSNEVVAEVPLRPTFPAADTIVVSPGNYMSTTGVSFSSVQDLVADSPEGTTFVFEPGVYRLSKTIYPRKGQSFIGMPGAILSGAVQPQSGDIEVEDGLYRWSNLNLTNYSCQDPGHCLLPPDNVCLSQNHCSDPELCLKKCDQTGDCEEDDEGICGIPCDTDADCSNSKRCVWDCEETGGCEEGEKGVCTILCGGPCTERPLECHRCKYRNDLFFNDEVLTRVVYKEDVVPGTFYIEYAGADTAVYFLNDPTNQKVELSVLRNAISGSPGPCGADMDCSAYVTIKGLTIEKFGSVAQRGAIIAREADSTGEFMLYWVIEQNQIRWNHGNGVSAGKYAILRNNKIYENGQMGGRAGDHGILDGNEFSGNNYAGYKPSWEAGASKTAFSNYLVIRGNYVHDNLGHGLWTDIDNRHVVFEDNVTSYNDGDGIKHEISYDCAIRRNTSVGNHNSRAAWLFGSGILVQNSTHCDVYENQIQVDSLGNGLNILNEYRERLGVLYYGVENTVHRNQLSFAAGSGATSSRYEDNVYDFNVYDVLETFIRHFGERPGMIWRRFVELGIETYGLLHARGSDLSIPLDDPTVAWLTPGEGGNLGCGNAIDLEVEAEAAKDDRVVRVEFLLDDVPFAQTSKSPYRVQWYYPASGSHELKAVVYTLRAQSSETAPMTVSIPLDCP